MRARLACAARAESAASRIGAAPDGPLVDAADGPSAVIDGRPVLNFVSASYLGIDHGAWLRREAGSRGDLALSLSAPRALATDAGTHDLEQALARLVQRPAALVGPSTLHLLVDVVRALALPRGTALFDARSYPLTLSALAVARGLGARVVSFRHHDPASLREALRKCRRGPRVALCDGMVLPGNVAPLYRLAHVCEDAGATLVVDDTQAFGLLGERGTVGTPYGTGGGGAARYAGCASPSLLIVASLAKSFGVPLAFLAGSAELVERVRTRADFLSTSSPPDLVSVRAALAALELNASTGDALRRQLARNVAELRAEARTWARGLFPVQSWYIRSPRQAEVAHRALLERGVWTVWHPHPPDAPGRTALRFVVTAAHTEPVLARALDAIRKVRREVLAC